jgi:hypothetical protein
MRQPARERSKQDRRNRVVEIICVVLVLAAVAALVLGIIAHSGGGVLNQGAIPRCCGWA